MTPDEEARSLEQILRALTEDSGNVFGDLGRLLVEARDPARTLARLQRFVARERAFLASPASLDDQQLAAARAAGVPAHLAATVRRN